ncbi:MAG: hypothetical protein ABI777_08225 [Betaproteobacteria bacterium]
MKEVVRISFLSVISLIDVMRPLCAIAMALTIASIAHAQTMAPTPIPNKRCEAAEKRIARENRDLKATLETLGREHKARETCSTRSVCARIDDNIATLEKRHYRHEIRLVRSRGEALEVCRGK